MDKKDYWINFWKTNAITKRATAHEKVGRTINGVPIEDSSWQEVLDDLARQLRLSPDDRLLDIGAGSGVISIPFAKKIKQVTALDVSSKLLAEMGGVPNIKTIEADALKTDFDAKSFDKIVIYFAIQHFTEEETTLLLKKIFGWLKPGGILYIGDVPDIARQFRFFNTPERQKAYFDSLVNDAPIIGTWFHEDFFRYLGTYSGFSSTSIIQQPKHFINAHYRYDVKFIKP